MMVDLGAIVGAMAVGQMAQHFSYGWGFALSGVVMFAAGIGWIFAPETRVPGQSASEAWETGGAPELA
jgi:dipeptide/tripeptide permease